MDYEIEQDYNLSISFGGKRSRIYLHKKTLKTLGNPEYVQFFLNLREKKLVLQSSKLGQKGAVPVVYKPPLYTSIRCIALLKIIWKLCRWDSDSTYKVFGKYYKGHNLVSFDLSDSVCMTPQLYDIDIEAEYETYWAEDNASAL